MFCSVQNQFHKDSTTTFYFVSVWSSLICLIIDLLFLIYTRFYVVLVKCLQYFVHCSMNGIAPISVVFFCSHCICRFPVCYFVSPAVYYLWSVIVWLLIALSSIVYVSFCTSPLSYSTLKALWQYSFVVPTFCICGGGVNQLVLSSLCVLLSCGCSSAFYYFWFVYCQV